MTPLAHSIVRELTLPVKSRTLRDKCGLLKRMADIHCFECSDVVEAAWQLGGDLMRRPNEIGRLAFLPAPRTWIEWKSPNGGREGVLLSEVQFEGRPHSALIDIASERKFGTASAGVLLLMGSLTPGCSPVNCLVDGGCKSDPGYGEATLYFFYALLAMINTPRVIGRRQHMPNRGLEKRLLAERTMVGKFPLHAWTEIKLEIGPSKVGGENSFEAHLTGERALHFCRAHLRVRFGRVEIVRGHWRGDPSLGIKQSRYKLVS